MKEENVRKKLILLPLPKLQKMTDTVFQRMRRLEESDYQGVVRCISCGAYGDYGNFDAGHFIPRQHKGCRYEKINVWPQCKKCNKWLHGNYAKYRDGLLKMIGKDGVENLEQTKDSMPCTNWRDWCIEVYIDSKKTIKKHETCERVTVKEWPK